MSRVAKTSQQTLNFSQNLIPNSETWSGYTTTSATISEAVIANPITGTLTGKRIVEGSAAASYHRAFTLVSGILNFFVPYTASVYLKNDTRRYAGLELDSGPGSSRVLVDLQTGSISATAQASNISSITPFVEREAQWPAGWYRVGLTIVPNTNLSIVGMNVQIVMSNNGTLTTYDGDGSSAVYGYGFQFVQTNWMCQYTPTTGSASTNPIRNKVISRAAVTSRALIS